MHIRTPNFFLLLLYEIVCHYNFHLIARLLDCTEFLRATNKFALHFSPIKIEKNNLHINEVTFVCEGMPRYQYTEQNRIDSNATRNSFVSAKMLATIRCLLKSIDCEFTSIELIKYANFH